jgi:prepilin-type N-terminal cleavage/methylation domain-containing protein
MKKIRGFTLAELLLVVAIAGVVLLMAGAFISRCIPSGDQAEKDARKWAASMGYDIQGMSCVNFDTDGDGYVSCTLNVKGDAQPVAVECAASTSLNSGCRMQKPGFAQ